jgi:hypothetical protein
VSFNDEGDQASPEEWAQAQEEDLASLRGQKDQKHVPAAFAGHMPSAANRYIR